MLASCVGSPRTLKSEGREARLSNAMMKRRALTFTGQPQNTGTNETVDALLANVKF